MTFDLTRFLHPGDLIYQIAFTVDPENASDGSTWLILAVLVVFGLLCWETERHI